MGDINELINSIEVEHEQAIKQRDKALVEVKYMLESAKQEGRAALTPEEDERIDALRATKDRLKLDIKGIERKLENARQAKADELETEEYAKAKTETRAARPAYDQVARVGSEERTYHSGKDRKGAQFLRDVARQYLFRDLEAEHRLSRHMQEERVERGQYLQRAAGTSNFTGLTVPQYLTDLYAPAVAAMRPFADICSKHDLPESGMTVNISRITTPATVGLQTAQNAAVPAQDLQDTLLTLNVQTAAGQETLSRQAIDRGTGIEEVTMNDLFKRYSTNLDSTLINQASTGLSAMANNVGVTATTFSGAGGFYPSVMQAASNAEAALLNQATPSHVVMHSRRWYWLNNILTSQWPAINQPYMPDRNTGTNESTVYNRGFRGHLPNGLGVIVDNNITTTGGGTAGTQDEAYVVAAEECHLWEDPQAPVFIRADQPAAANLGVLLVLYGYFAYTVGRYPNAPQKLTGAGMVTPTFSGS